MASAVLVLPFPPSVNALYAHDRKTNRRFIAKRYAAWKGEAGFALAQQKPLPRFPGKIYVTMRFGRPDRRRRDVANFEKAVSDLLVSAGVIVDDCLIERNSQEWDDAIVGCQVEIEDAP